jgi:hypothetical protein
MSRAMSGALHRAVTGAMHREMRRAMTGEGLRVTSCYLRAVCGCAGWGSARAKGGGR